MTQLPTSLIRRDEVVQQISLLRSRLEDMMEAVSPSDEVVEQVTPDDLYLTLETIISVRKRRIIVFGENLFGEPAWDMLLEMYRNQVINRTESVSSICYASGVPPTTALRWLRALERGGWIDRRPDESDGRKFNLLLTEKSRQALDALFMTRNCPRKRVAAAQS